MSMYAVKNKEGKWLRTDTFGTCYWKDEIYDAERYIDPASARHDAERSGGHIVELTEKSAPVVVSEAEAEMLEQSKCDEDPAELLVGFVNSHDKYEDDGKAEDRLMRAYVNGWQVEKPKRFNVKVPHMREQYYYVDDEGELRAADRDTNDESNQQFTLAEIEHYGLQDCERVEVKE